MATTTKPRAGEKEATCEGCGKKFVVSAYGDDTGHCDDCVKAMQDSLPEGYQGKVERIAKAKSKDKAATCAKCGGTMVGSVASKTHCDRCIIRYIEAHKDPVAALALTEVGNAERFAVRFKGKFVFTDATGWMTYDADSGRWTRDTKGAVDRAMVETIRKIPLEVELLKKGDSDEDMKAAEDIREAYIGWAKKCESHAKVVASLARASRLLEFVRDYTDFDQKPNLFNCANGTYELDTMRFRPHDPTDLLTKGSDVVYAPLSKCPKWERFILDVMDGSEEMRKYLARCCGYTMSAETAEQCLFIPYGIGGTGKGTFLRVLEGILGSYCKTADAEMFLSKHGDSGQPFDMAGLEGVRALLASETDEGKRLAVSKVKRMSGQDTVRACFKHKDSYQFRPQWKIWLATNDRPQVAAGDDAAWDRIKTIPFDTKFRGTERQIEDLDKLLLAEEASGILNWFIAGYKLWKKEGLEHPDAVVKATEDWRETEDFLQRFLDERTAATTKTQEYVGKADLFKAFERWAEDNKEAKNVNNRAFGEMMRKKGYKDSPIKQGDKNVKIWVGLKPVSPSQNWAPQPVDPKDMF
jgi:putative DNA primase/helicase